MWVIANQTHVLRMPWVPVRDAQCVSLNLILIREKPVEASGMRRGPCKPAMRSIRYFCVDAGFSSASLEEKIIFHRVEKSHESSQSCTPEARQNLIGKLKYMRLRRPSVTGVNPVRQLEGFACYLETRD